MRAWQFSDGLRVTWRDSTATDETKSKDLTHCLPLLHYLGGVFCWPAHFGPTTRTVSTQPDYTHFQNSTQYAVNQRWIWHQLIDHGRHINSNYGPCGSNGTPVASYFAMLAI